jgi:signal transduction histidine kinase/DNA-binding response OmpR family regulator
MKKLLFLLCLLIDMKACPLYSQFSKLTDSLKQALTKAKTTEDSVGTLSWLAWSSWETDKKLTFEYGTRALKLSQRIQDKGLIAGAYDAAALGYWVSGNPDRAKELYTASLEIGLKYNLPDPIGWANFNMAELELNRKNYKEAHAHARAARKAFVGLSDMETVVRTDWFLINSYEHRGQNPWYDTLINDLQLVIKDPRDPAKLLEYYQYLTYLYERWENKAQSLFYTMKILEISEKLHNEKGMLSAYYRIGTYLRDYQHNYGVAILYFQKIYDILKKNNEEYGIADVLNEMGNTYRLSGNNSQALDLFNQSLEISLRLKHKHSISNAYRNTGELFYQEKKYDDALKYFLMAYETGCDRCPPITFHEVLIDIGKVYLDMNDFYHARQYFTRSLALADSAHAEHELARSYVELADLDWKADKGKLTLAYYHKAHAIASSINVLSLQKEIASKLSKVYATIGNFQKAYDYVNLSNRLADSLAKITETENLSRLETVLEFQNYKAQKDLEQAKSNDEIARQSQQKYFFLTALILVSILGIVVYRNFRRKKRDSKILLDQKIQIEEMLQKVHEADQRRLNFFTNISHEFRTPLTLILSPVEKLIKEFSFSEEITSLLRLTRRNTLQLFNLINQLLNIRKLDIGKVKLRVSEGDIVHYCKGIFSTFSHLAGQKNIVYDFRFTDEKIVAWFDRDILEKSLNNLLSNAFKHTPRNGKISVSVLPCSKQDGKVASVKISVSDNGSGIPEDQMRYVFDRYYQVESTNTGFNMGAGIGLAYTKELIELHRGQISVENDSRVQSDQWGSTTFTIILPVHGTDYSHSEKSTINSGEKEIEIEEAQQEYLKEIVASNPDCVEEFAPKIVEEESDVMLIVEDNADLRGFVKSIFEKEYITYEASEGGAGYRIATELIPDIIISDIMMPVMDGLELCKKIKSHPHTNHIPVLLLTAKAEDEHEIEGLSKGADDYVVKPFNSDLLKARVRNLVLSRERLKEHFTRKFLLMPDAIQLSSPDDELLRNAVTIIEKNISNANLNIELLMNQLGISRIQLFRKIKALTGYTPSHLIRNIRLKRAAQLLKQNSLTVSEVLYQSGFNSPSYFSSCFKEMYGCLPKEYVSKNVPAKALR